MRSRYVVLTGREGGPQDRIFLGDRLARALGLRRGDAVRVEGRRLLVEALEEENFHQSMNGE